MRAAAFSAFLSGSGGKHNWRQYLDKCGLGDSLPRLTQEEKEAEKKRALSLADKIKKLDQRKSPKC